MSSISLENTARGMDCGCEFQAWLEVRVSLCLPWEGQREYLRQWPMGELKLFAAQLRKEGELAVQAT
jgi:hypothetical protein